MLTGRQVKLFGALAFLLFLGALFLGPRGAQAASGPLAGKSSGQVNFTLSLGKDQSIYYYRLVNSSTKYYCYSYPGQRRIYVYYRPYTTIPQPQPQPQQPQPQPQQPQPQPQPPSGSVGELTADEQRMVDLVNQERSRYGLSPLKVNLDLVKVARLKARDMVENNYFSHTSPVYGSPFEMMKSFGITYRTAGENLAGASDVEVAHRNLMNSSGHRANILNSAFSEVGIGVVNGSAYGKIFVQLFKG